MPDRALRWRPRGARTGLDAYRADFGAFLSSAKPNLTKDAVAEALVARVSSVFDAIDAQGAHDPQAFEKLREADMPSTANVLAGAIATQFPEQFPGSSPPHCSPTDRPAPHGAGRFAWRYEPTFSRGVQHRSRRFSPTPGKRTNASALSPSPLRSSTTPSPHFR